MNKRLRLQSDQDGIPKLVVVMVARNSERTIKKAAKSALRALPENSFLHVLLDDCEDSTEEVVRSIFDSRINISATRTRLGPAEARNEIISKTKSDFIAIVDADDIVLPWHFLFSIRKINAQKLDMCFSNCFIFAPQRTILKFVPQLPIELNPEESPHWLTDANPFVHSSAVIRRNVLEKLGGYSIATPSEDYDLWLRAASNKFRLGKFNGFGIVYRMHSQQLSASSSWKSKIEASQNLKFQRIELRRELEATTSDQNAGINYVLKNNITARIFYSKFFELIKKYFNRN